MTHLHFCLTTYRVTWTVSRIPPFEVVCQKVIVEGEYVCDIPRKEFSLFTHFLYHAYALIIPLFPRFPSFATIAKEVTIWQLNGGYKLPFCGIA